MRVFDAVPYRDTFYYCDNKVINIGSDTFGNPIFHEEAVHNFGRSDDDMI